MTTAITVHGVLGGAYKGKRLSLRALLNHASNDGGDTALCGGVKAGHLVDQYGMEPDAVVTCTKCIGKMNKNAY